MGLFGIFNSSGAAEIYDEDIRSDVAKSCKDGVDPRTALADWGDYDIDHSDSEHDASNGKQSSGGSTLQSVKTFYDSCRPANIKITGN